MSLTALPNVPGFVPAWSIVAEAADELEPPRRRGVVDCTIENRVLANPGGGYSGPWQMERAPWTEAPMAALSSELYELVAIKGSAQVAKSEIILNWLEWTVIDDPANFILLQPSKEMAKDFVQTRVEPMIRSTPAMGALQRTDRSADNIFSKRFRGCHFWAVWPVIEQLSSRPAPRWAIDDSDRVPEDIGGQGSAEQLLAGRQTTFEGRAVGLKCSTPSLGARRGIEADFDRGTAERWFMPCPSCGEYFAPTFDDLNYDREGTPDQARESARLICPSNGCVIDHREKRAMNLAGVWAGPDQVVDQGGQVTGPARETRVASFHFSGLHGFASWGKLAERHREAVIAWETTADEAPLRAYFNTAIGINYVGEHDDAAPLEAEGVGARRAAADYKLGEVPGWAVCLTAAVDVQGNRFEVGVFAWGPGLECALVDRFAIMEAEGGRSIAPAKLPEQWGLILDRVIWRKYPIKGRDGAEARIANTSIDTGGLDGVSVNATTFWHTARAAGVVDGAITLVKGGSHRSARLISRTYLEVDAHGRPRKSGATVWILNVTRFKDIADARLRRETPGAGFIHLPRDLADDYVDELVAEEKKDGLWVKTRPRNETLDLLVYANAGVARHGGERPNLSWVPPAYRIAEAAADETTDGDELEAADHAADDQAPAAPVVVRRPRSAPPRRPARGGGFVNGWRN